LIQFGFFVAFFSRRKPSTAHPSPNGLPMLHPPNLSMFAQPPIASDVMQNAAVASVASSTSAQAMRAGVHSGDDAAVAAAVAAAAVPSGPAVVGGATDRSSMGLRHFSVKVCEKLSTMGTTTYNDIANALMDDYRAEVQGTVDVALFIVLLFFSELFQILIFFNKAGDEKNVRRRIYDALNVLCAMDIIFKDKKTIRWKGMEFSQGVSVEHLRVAFVSSAF
jgi:transcription factor Dp-1